MAHFVDGDACESGDFIGRQATVEPELNHTRMLGIDVGRAVNASSTATTVEARSGEKSRDSCSGRVVTKAPLLIVWRLRA